MRLRDDGVGEITLLGQNVNSYHDRSEASAAAYRGTDYATSAGFGNTFRSRGGAGAYFAELLAEVCFSCGDGSLSSVYLLLYGKVCYVGVLCL